jgi:hypothetical protein
MIINETINKTNFFYTDEHKSSNLGEYYEYIVRLLKKIFIEEEIHYDVNFGVNNLKKNINLDFQYEHIIVKNEDKYKYNIYRYDYLKTLDCVFEYTNTNVHFLSTFNELSDYSKKNIYIPPLIYDDYHISNFDDRVNDVTTIHSWTKRRSEFHIKRKHDNISNVFNKNQIKNLLNTYKVLLNIHQIDEHLSFEELRVLPALSTGILVVSEDVPFKEKVPYYEHIIWCSYEDIEKTLEDVLNNYEYYREKKLTGLSDTIKKMKNKSEEDIKYFFKNYDTFYNTTL